MESAGSGFLCAVLHARPFLLSDLLPLSTGDELVGLVAFQSPLSNGAMTGAELPTRLKLLNWGENQTTKGPVRVGQKTVAALAANQARYGFDKIALDFAHNSLKGHPNFKEDPREVAAYGVPQVIEGDGLYLDKIEYTPAGKKFAANYADLSPTPRLTDGEVDFLHSVALCPQGSVTGLSFFSCAFLDLSAKHVAIAAASKTMDYKKLLLTLLGLADDASDADLETAAKAAAGKLSATKPNAEETAPEEDSDVVKAMNVKFDALEKRLIAFTGGIEAKDRKTLLAQAAGDGKVVPLAAHDLPMPTLTALVAQLPVTVPLDQRTPERIREFAAGSGPANDAQRTVMAALGISEDDWKKHQPKA